MTEGFPLTGSLLELMHHLKALDSVIMIISICIQILNVGALINRTEA